MKILRVGSTLFFGGVSWFLHSVAIQRTEKLVTDTPKAYYSRFYSIFPKNHL